jgi:hypothetical protein
MANALTHIAPLKQGAGISELMETLSKNKGAIDHALQETGTVHDFRFVIFDGSSPNLLPQANSTGPFFLGVITTYDGSFEAYIQDFVRFLGPVFDALLPNTVDGGHLVPVQDNIEGLIEWVRKDDAAQHPPNSEFRFYTGYPYTVQQILAADIQA